MKTNKYISEELLAAFIDGTTTQEQNDLILESFKQNPDFFTEFKIAFYGANIFKTDLDELSINSKDLSIVSGTIIGNEIYNSLNLFDHSEIQNQHSLVAASNNHHSGDRIHELLDSIFENNHHNQNMETINSNQIIGENPVNIVSNDVQQQYNDTCAIKSQQLILNDFGIPVSEDQLVQQAENLNIYHPGQGGTSPQDVGKLLELNGVSCTQHENASVYDLTSALAKGEKIIVGVDSKELWDGGVISHLNDLIHGEQADHALIVAGINTTDPNNVQVILTDPGTGQEGARYPIAQFMDAWRDSGNFMVTTDAPAPLDHNPEMANFDYSQGHIPFIGQMPYDYFEQTMLPLSHDITSDPILSDILTNDCISMMQGEINTFSPELIHSFEHSSFNHLLPDILENQFFEDFQVSDNTDYYNDQTGQQEDSHHHGDIDNAQDHQHNADDYFNHIL